MMPAVMTDEMSALSNRTPHINPKIYSNVIDVDVKVEKNNIKTLTFKIVPIIILK